MVERPCIIEYPRASRSPKIPQPRRRKVARNHFTQWREEHFLLNAKYLESRHNHPTGVLPQEKIMCPYEGKLPVIQAPIDIWGRQTRGVDCQYLTFIFKYLLKNIYFQVFAEKQVKISCPNGFKAWRNYQLIFGNAQGLGNGARILRTCNDFPSEQYRATCQGPTWTQGRGQRFAEMLPPFTQPS